MLDIVMSISSTPLRWAELQKRFKPNVFYTKCILVMWFTGILYIIFLTSKVSFTDQKFDSEKRHHGIYQVSVIVCVRACVRGPFVNISITTWFHIFTRAFFSARRQYILHDLATVHYNYTYKLSTNIYLNLPIYHWMQIPCMVSVSGPLCRLDKTYTLIFACTLDDLTALPLACLHTRDISAEFYQASALLANRGFWNHPILGSRNEWAKYSNIRIAPTFFSISSHSLLKKWTLWKENCDLSAISWATLKCFLPLESRKLTDSIYPVTDICMMQL